MADGVGTGVSGSVWSAAISVWSLRWDLVGSCWSELPGTFGVSVERLFGVVDEVVAVHARQRRLIDIRFAFDGRVPWDQVMHFAFADISPAQHTAFVSSDEASDLCGRCVTDRPTQRKS